MKTFDEWLISEGLPPIDTKEALRAEAIIKLRGYLKTGVEGFLQQALDRCQAMGINCDGVSRDQVGATNLLNHLSMR